MRAPRRAFPALWAGQATSNLADGLLQAAAPLLVASLTRDPLVVAGLTIVQFLPWVVATLPAGVLADRVDRRRILLWGNWLRGAGFLVLAASTMAGWHHVALLYAAVFVAGCAETLVDNAALTIPPRLVPRERLERANGLLFATQSVINSFVGPPAGAALFALAASAAFYLGAAGYVIAGLVTLLLPTLRPEASERDAEHGTPAGVVADIRAGWGHFWQHRLLRRVAIVSAAINVGGSMTGGLLVLLLTGPYGVQTRDYGVFLAVPAGGAVLGALLAERIVRRLGGGPVTMAAVVMPALSYLILGVGHHAGVVLAAMFGAGFATAVNQIVVSTLRQAVVPDHLLGRVTAAYRLVVLGVVPVGALAGGLIGRSLGVRAPFVVASAAMAVVAVFVASRVTTSALREAESRPNHPPGEGWSGSHRGQSA